MVAMTTKLAVSVTAFCAASAGVVAGVAVSHTGSTQDVHLAASVKKPALQTKTVSVGNTLATGKIRSWAKATCPKGYKLTGGGYADDYNSAHNASSVPVIEQSYPTGNAWYVQQAGRTGFLPMDAYVTCSRIK